MPICKRYITMDPNGEVCGPCMKTEDLCWQALRMGYERSTAKIATNQIIQEMGYKVVLCTVHWGEDPVPEEVVYDIPE